MSCWPCRGPAHIVLSSFLASRVFTHICSYALSCVENAGRGDNNSLGVVVTPTRVFYARTRRKPFPAVGSFSFLLFFFSSFLLDTMVLDHICISSVYTQIFVDNDRITGDTKLQSLLCTRRIVHSTSPSTHIFDFFPNYARRRLE